MLGPAEGEFGLRRRRRWRRSRNRRAVGVDGNPGLWRGWCRSGRRLALRHRHLALTGRTLELVAAPQLVARDFLIAVRADKFDFSHNVRLLFASSFSVRAEFHGAGTRTDLFTTLPGIHVKEMCIVRTSAAGKYHCTGRQMCSAIHGGG